MFTVEARTHIARPVAEVSQYLLEPANYPRWISDVRSVQATGPFRQGQTIQEVTVLQGQETTSTVVIVTVRANSTLVMRVTVVHSGPKPLPTRTFIVTPAPDGAELSWRSDVQVGGM